MKFLIFGGNGFIGKALSSFIKCQGDEVLSVSKSGKGKSFALNIAKKVEFGKLKFIPDVVINCASIIPSSKSLENDDYLEELFLTNVVGGVNISNWAIKNYIPKIINCSTLVVVKKPWPNPLEESFSNIPEGPHVGYCMSKLSQEQLMNEAVKNVNTKLIHLRLSAVYGVSMPPNGIIFALLEKLKKNEAIQLTDANKNTFDFIHVSDVCKSIYEIAKSNFENEIINLASGQPISLLKLANTMKKISKSSSVINDSETNGVAYVANVSVEKLRKRIGEIYNHFLPLEKGLKEIIINNR